MATSKLNIPVYFINPIDNRFYLGLDDYLQNEGAVLKLGYKKKPSKYGVYTYVNTKISAENILNKYDFSSVNEAKQEQRLQCLNFRYFFLEFSHALIVEKKKKQAYTILKRTIELFPNSLFPYNGFDILFIELFYSLKKYQEGNFIAKELIYNIKNDIDAYKQLYGTSRYKYPEMLLTDIRTLAEKHKQEEIINILDAE